MNINLLQRLLAVPTISGREDAMVSFLVEHVEADPAKRGRVERDQFNNVYITKGEAEFYPCVAAHIDTVFPLGHVNIVRDNGTFIGTDDAGKRTGIGGDCKTGVHVCLELLETFDNIKVALFASEEIGCVGAFNAASRFFDDVGYVIEFDCPSTGLMSYTSSGERLFENYGAFIRTAMRALQSNGVTRWQRHPYTDVMALRKRFKFSCLNIGSGYYNWHSSQEFVKLDDVRQAISTGMSLITDLGERSYPVNDLSGTPMVEVTGLIL